ncbi:MAG: GNAT family N-acetyltransferase [Deltaproteobacteria bacterium]|nr:MAG: GNAT family N-acetyltransferase [Deltaproteobacteria bacterium]
MKKKVKIRGLTLKDLPAIIEIDRKVLGKPRPEYWKRKIEVSEFRPPLASLVAEFDGKVIGFILGDVSGWEFGVPDNTGMIETVGIDPAYQRQGIARLLTEELIRSFRLNGVQKINTLIEWDDWDLLQFFYKMGFRRGQRINLELDLTEQPDGPSE